jgi:hypothetical protein
MILIAAGMAAVGMLVWRLLQAQERTNDDRDDEV